MKKLFSICCLAMLSLLASAQAEYGKDYIKQIGERSSTFVSRRPTEKDRLFCSDIIDQKIKEVQKLLKENPKLAWMFGNCFPNTLDTTVHYSDASGDDDTFVYTGDIHAMWLRDSGAQVWPYVQFAGQDPELSENGARHHSPTVQMHLLRSLRQCVQPYTES